MDTILAVAIFVVITALGIQLLRDIRNEYRTTQSKRTLGTAAVITLLVLAGGGIVVYDILTVSTDTQTIPTSGVVPQEVGDVQIEIWWDIFAQDPVTSIDWGELDLTGGAGRTDVEVSFYVRNAGGDSFTSNFTTTNWVLTGANSGAEPGDWFHLSWTFGELSLSPGRQRKVTMTLGVDNLLIGVDAFTFDIVITAWEA